jgi:hypothetical protein
MSTILESDGTIVAYYDLRTAPITFDFTHYIAAAAAYAQARGKPYFDLVLVADAFRNVTPREKSYTLVERQWRLWNLILEVVKVVPFIQNVAITRRPLKTKAAETYPPQYDPVSNPKIPYSVPMVRQFHDMGINVKVFRPSIYAQKAAERLVPRTGKKLFCITLRKAGFDAARDSRLNDWYQFYKLLESRGYDVVIIPDQDDALSDRSIHEYDWRVLDVAAMSIDLRLALYHRADMNYVTNGGMIGIFLYSKVPYFWFSVAVEGSHIASEEFYRGQGVERGGKYAWLAANQEMVWEPDTLENLTRSLDRIKFKEPA